MGENIKRVSAGIGELAWKVEDPKKKPKADPKLKVSCLRVRGSKKRRIRQKKHRPFVKKQIRPRQKYLKVSTWDDISKHKEASGRPFCYLGQVPETEQVYFSRGMAINV